ncbi:MAG: PDZ domain-containing protein [Oscillospiraceae bacterium]|jgi:carboxyl-terminal processing protease|nr:PDZ domain-containing protein [Oscillospiraceae bacterium]
MKNKFFSRLTAAALALVLLSAPGAQALTVDQAAELLQRVYVDEVPQTVLEQTTIQDMLAALGDPYTEYFTPEEYGAFTATMSDTSLVGIGVVYTQTEEGLLLSEVLEGSPAEKGGLEPDDLIVKVDGRSVLGETTDTVSGWIQGEEDTEVKVTYLRDGNRKTVTLTRALVVVAATTTQLIDGHIGYISCSTFGMETVGHFQEGIEKYRDQVSAWIVDLRSNTGGVTQAAVDAAGCFTGTGEMAYLRDGSDAYGVYYHEDDSLTLHPVIVLMDPYSASASEIFASAIRDRGAGIVIGTRSYGKGVAQTVIDREFEPEYFADGDAIKITSHRFFTPAGNSTDQVGVIPDLLLPPDQVIPAAYLLAGPGFFTDTSGLLRVDMQWRWHIDLETALSEEYRETFQAILDAITVNRKIWSGIGGPDGWARTDLETVCGETGMEFHAPAFPDQEDCTYTDAVSILRTYDMLHGREDGKFYPQDTLTRAELCQLLAVALNCSVPINESPYSDVPEDAWYTPAVVAMSNMGLVNGTGNDSFSPDEPVDHQQFITILGRLAQRLNLYLYDDVKGRPQDAVDVVGLWDYADWAKESAWLLSYSQKGYFGNTITLLWDEAGEISPTEATTREEAAYALYRLLSYLNILPV